MSPREVADAKAREERRRQARAEATARVAQMDPGYRRRLEREFQAAREQATAISRRRHP